MNLAPQPTHSDLNRQYGIILGLPGAGKSTFTSQIPGALVLNLDLRGTLPHVPSPAHLWPTINPDTGVVQGQYIEGPQITWKSMLAVREFLIQNAGARGMPTTVVIDTVSSMIAVVQSGLVEWFNEKYNYGFSNWSDLIQKQGAAAWGSLSSAIEGYCYGLSSAGYGVIMLGHVGFVGESLEVRLSPGQQSKFEARPAYVALLETGYVTPPLQKGQRLADLERIPQTVLSFRHAKLPGVLKCSIPLPLDKEDKLKLTGPFGTHWTQFRDVWNNASRTGDRNGHQGI